MGYTHYYTTKKVTPKVWGVIVKDCKKLFNNMPKHSKSSGGYYENYPLEIFNDGNGETDINSMFRDETDVNSMFSKLEIRFNGVSRGEDLGHETFVLEPTAKSDFCKTARKPYDLMVQACLLVYQYHSPKTITLGTDGCAEDWEEAENFIKTVLGYSVKFH